MSYCKKDGKDKAVFVTKEDYDNKEALSFVVNDEEYGAILPNGEINWDCPCLGGVAYGPCGEEFKSSFSCFHQSQEEMKGSDCVPHFRAMQECFQKYPDLYPQDDDDDDDSNSDVIPARSDSSKDESSQGVAEGSNDPGTLSEKEASQSFESNTSTAPLQTATALGTSSSSKQATETTHPT